MILVINSGSSSVKYRTVDPNRGQGQRGLIERIGEPGGPADHGVALERMFTELPHDRSVMRAVGHRVVHGGPRFTQPTMIDDGVLRDLRDLVVGTS